MSTRCLLDAIEEIRRFPDVDQDTREQVVQTLTKIASDQSLTPERTKAALLAAGKDMRRDMYTARVSKVINDQKIEDFFVRLAEIEDIGQRAEYWRGFLEGAGKMSRVDTADVASRIRSEENRLLAALNPVWDYIAVSKVSKGAGTIRASKNADQFNLALHGAREGIDPEAIRLAELYVRETKPYMDRLRASGRFVGELENPGYQSHSPSKIASNYDEWREFLKRALHKDYHPDAYATAEALYTKIQTRHLEDVSPNNITFGRQIHFKTPELAVEYTKRFGDSPTHFGILSRTRQMVRQGILSERLGPQYDRTITEVTERLQNQAALAVADAQRRLASAPKGEKAAAKRELKNAKAAVREANAASIIGPSMTGAFGSPKNHQLANILGSARNWMVFQYLGQVPLAMVGTDSWISIIRGRFHTGGFASSTAEHFKVLSSLMSEGQMRHYAREIGVWQHSVTMAAMDRYATPFAQSELIKGATGQLATAAQRLSGSHALESAFRSASLVVVSRSLVRNLRMGWDDLPRKYKVILEGNGIRKDVWQRLQREHQVVPEIETLNWQALPADLKEHVTAFMYREADSMTLYPGYYDRAMLTFGAQAGTIPGELAASGTQFWAWPITAMRKVMNFELHHGGAGSVGAAAALMLGGAVAVQMYAMAKNEPMFEWDSSELWLRAAGRSGLLTPVGELVLNAMRYNRLEVGPIGGTGTMLAQALFQGGGDYLAGEADRAARRTAQLAEGLAVPNIWWLQYGITSRAMDSIQWSLDPQYMQSRERRFRDEGRMGY